MPPEPVTALADAEAFRQVFRNLARNALNAMPDGGTSRGEVKWTDTGNVCVVFTDTGRGMSPAQVERLFEPFSTSTSGGTGLGLSIVYQIIRDHGGTIYVRSREGHGTTITIELPRTEAESELGRKAMPRRAQRNRHPFARAPVTFRKGVRVMQLSERFIGKAKSRP